MDACKGYLKAIKDAGLYQDLVDLVYGADITSELYDFCWQDEMDGFLVDMDYGTMKARTGDPYKWVANKLRLVTVGHDPQFDILQNTKTIRIQILTFVEFMV